MMNLLTNYPEFKQDIEYSFKNLIQEFDFGIAELYEGCYILKGANCNIRFSFDRGDVSCSFKQPFENQEPRGYNVLTVYRFIYHIDDYNHNSENITDPKQQLVNYAQTIEKYLKNVLRGDFSWLNGFLEKQERENKVHFFVLNLDNDNPIKEKFWNGDLSWRHDVEKYLNENNITL